MEGSARTWFTPKQKAERIGVSKFTVLNWERAKTSPQARSIPALIRVLAYDPLPQPTTIAEKLIAAGTRKGWSRKRTAAYLGVDEGTLRGWEAGKPILFRKHQVAVTRILESHDADLEEETRTNRPDSV